MNTRNTIVMDRPELKSGVRRGAECTITLLAWSAFSYLLLPVITLFLWAIGLRFLFIEQWRLIGWRALGGVLIGYAGILTVIGMILLWWSVYNRRRFDREDPRKWPEAVSVEELAGRYGVSVDTVDALRKARIVVVDFESRPTRWEEVAS